MCNGCLLRFLLFCCTMQCSNSYIESLNNNYCYVHRDAHYNLKCHTTSLLKATCRNPNLAKCGGEAQHLEKLGIWSPPGLPNVQSSTAGPKTPRIGVFLVSLERSWSVDIENALALGIWTSVAQVMGKRRAGSQIGSWLPTTKSRESTSSRSPNRECDTSLERSRRGLQVRFRPRSHPISQSGVMSSQSPGTPPGTISGQLRDSISGVPGICAIWM